MTTSFYAPSTAFHGGRVVLPEDEAAHAVRVLRHRPGDEIVVVDGAGGWHRVRLDHVDRRRAAGTVVETRHGVGEPTYRLSIGLGLIKQRSRFETFLEKAVELGVAEIVPLATERTEKGSVNAARAEKLLVAAMKQCGRALLPALRDPTPLAEVLDDASPALRLLAHEAAGPHQALGAVLARHSGAETIRVLVGPEGGFSDAEVGAAAAAGYGVVSLGSRRLRAETAGIVVAAAVQLAHP